MSADILSDPTHPHGTAEGFARGCRGSHCPAPVTCRVVHLRYHGDFGFRRAIDSGMTPEAVLAAEAEDARRAAEEERAAKRRRPGPRAKASTGDRRPAANRARAATRVLVPRESLRALLDEGLTDAEIGARLGFSRRQVAGARTTAKWARNPERKDRTTSHEAPAPSGASSS